MHILIDATAQPDMHNGAMRRIVELFSRVSAHGGAHRFSILARQETHADLTRSLPAADVVALEGGGGGPVSRVLGHNRALRRWVRDNSVDLVHQDALPLAIPRLTVPTVHDLRFLHPELSPPLLHRIYGRVLLPGIFRQCPLLLTVSHYIAHELETLCGIPPGKVRIVPNGVDPVRFRGPADDGILHRHDLENGGYIVFVGHREPRKNIPVLIRMLPLMADRGLDHCLVVIGRRVPGYSEPENLVKELDLSDRVRFIENVGDNDLPSLYAGAAAALMPSLYEGFCIPVLEAMAAGTPVIASKDGPFPETAGSRALADPRRPEEWVTELERIVAHGDARQAALAEGAVQAAKYDWDAAAGALVDGYGCVGGL